MTDTFDQGEVGIQDMNAGLDMDEVAMEAPDQSEAGDAGVGTCGNGVIEANEECDQEIGTSLCMYGLRECSVCDENCRWVAGKVRFCGDGNIDFADGEECERSDSACTERCKFPTCEDNEQNGDEIGVDCGGGTCPSCLFGGVTSVAVGEWTTLASRNDGKVFYTGYQFATQRSANRPSIIPRFENITTVSMGHCFGCGLDTSTGEVLCLGENGRGQLGDGSTADRWTDAPELITLSGVTSLTSGADHSCAIKTDGTLWCWGYNFHGQIKSSAMLGTTITTPVLIEGVSDPVSEVSLGRNHSCLVTEDGKAYCWGYGLAGALGTGNSESRETPTLVVDGIKDVAAGLSHTCFITDTGEVICTGANDLQQLGDPAYTEANSMIPRPVPGVTDAKTIAAGEHHTCVVHVDGGVTCWGADGEGQLGRGDDWDNSGSASLGRVEGLENIEAVSAGGKTTCVLSRGGHIACFGDGERGQLGMGKYDTRSTAPMWIEDPEAL
jgi:hypothetical protein